MNIKDFHELLALLDEYRQEKIDLRKICDERSLEESALKDYYLSQAAKAGITASRLDYFIRMIEEIVVFKLG